MAKDANSFANRRRRDEDKPKTGTEASLAGLRPEVAETLANMPMLSGYGSPEAVAAIEAANKPRGERPTRGMGSGAAYRPSSHAGGMRTTGPNYADRVGNQKMPSRSGGGVAPGSQYGKGVGDEARSMARAYWDRMRAIRNADRPTPQAQGGRSWPNMAGGGGNLNGLAALARVIMGQQIGPGGTLNLPYFGRPGYGQPNYQPSLSLLTNRPALPELPTGPIRR